MTAVPGTSVGSVLARSQPERLVRHAFTLLVAHATEDRPLPPGVHPVVLVSAANGADGIWLDELEQSVTSGGGAVVRTPATDLAALLSAAARADVQGPRAACAPARLLIVESLDRLRSAGSQERFARLLDATAASGTAVCITLGMPPAAAGLVPELESRLMAGLVVPLRTLRRAADTIPGSRPSCGRVIRVTAAHCGIPVAAMLGSGRQRSVVHARSLAMYLARRLTGKSLDSLGRAFGGRDHSTVLRSVRAIEDHARADTTATDEIERLVLTIMRGQNRLRRGRRVAPSA